MRSSAVGPGVAAGGLEADLAEAPSTMTRSVPSRPRAVAKGVAEDVGGSVAVKAAAGPVGAGSLAHSCRNTNRASLLGQPLSLTVAIASWCGSLNSPTVDHRFSPGGRGGGGLGVSLGVGQGAASRWRSSLTAMGWLRCI